MVPSPLNLIMLGPPGAGKGTQAQRLVSDFELTYLSTGDVFRQAVDEGTELGRQAAPIMERGELIPDDITIGIVTERLEGADAAEGFILDGFPRTVPQAESLETHLREHDRHLSAVLLIEVDDEVVLKRIAGRRFSKKSGKVYNVHFDPPKHEGRCDVDGSELVQRGDDKPDVVRDRLETYRSQTSPLIDFYEGSGLLRRFDGSRSASEVQDRIRATLATLRLEEEL